MKIRKVNYGSKIFKLIFGTLFSVIWLVMITFSTLLLYTIITDPTAHWNFVVCGFIIEFITIMVLFQIVEFIKWYNKNKDE